MGVWCTDRLTGEVLGVPRLVWGLLDQSLHALQVARPEAHVPDGYVPSWLARSWGAALFDRMGELVVVCRPLPRRGPQLRPLGIYRSGSPAALSWARHGEQLSVYDLPLATLVLRYAQFCSAGTGHTATTLRPPAPGTPVSEVAARVRQARSGLLSAPTPRPPHDSHPARPTGPAPGHPGPAPRPSASRPARPPAGQAPHQPGTGRPLPDRTPRAAAVSEKRTAC